MVKTQFKIILAILVYTMLASTVPIFSRGFFMAVNGSDENDGSKEMPWATLNRSHATIQAGDTLFIRGGIYNSQPMVIWSRSGAPEQPIVIQAYPNEKPVFAGSNNMMHLFLIRESDCLVIDGLEAYGYRCAVWMGYLPENLDFAENNIICNNYFHDMQEHLIYLSWGIKNVQVYNNYLQNPGNELGTKGYCIHGWHGPGVQGAKIFNNIIIGGYGGIVFADGARDLEIYNNTFFDNYISLRFDFYGGGEGEEGFVKNVIIKNNIIYSTNSTLWSLFVAPENNKEIIIDYNIWYGPAQKQLIKWSGNMYDVNQFKENTSNGFHSTYVDPLFVDVSQFDFHLQPNSMAIDSGVLLQNLTTDKDLVWRPQGKGMDIGAYEYEQEVVAPDTTAPKPPTGVRIP